MILVLIILGLSCLSIIIGEVSGIAKWIKVKTGLKRLKPFDCPFCLSFWFAVTFCIAFQPNIENIIFIVGVTPILTLWILKKIQ
jgi:hypothetical protein